MLVGGLLVGGGEGEGGNSNLDTATLPVGVLAGGGPCQRLGGTSRSGTRRWSWTRGAGWGSPRRRWGGGWRRQQLQRCSVARGGAVVEDWEGLRARGRAGSHGRSVLVGFFLVKGGEVDGGNRDFNATVLHVGMLVGEIFVED